MVFLKYTTTGQNMGNNFSKDGYRSKMYDLYFKEGITGEKALLYNASIRKQFQYELEMMKTLLQKQECNTKWICNMILFVLINQ